MNNDIENKAKIQHSSNEFDKSKPRIHMLGDELKMLFGSKVVKLSIDGNFTCPNRDGSKGEGGCIFCSASGSGDNASNIDDQIDLLSKKWPEAKYIAYFQNHTGTYAPIDELREKYYKVLSDPRIIGLAIATRSDCISDECFELLNEINQNHFLWLELGLQTIHKKSSKSLNLCHDISDYDYAMERLNKLKIKTVTHLILGLPNESINDIKESVNHVISKQPWGIKLHLLNIISGTTLAKQNPNYMPFNSIDEYAELVCDLLEIIPYETVMHRLSADSPAKTLIAPKWAYRKRLILNTINQKLKERNSWQGKFSI